MAEPTIAEVYGSTSTETIDYLGVSKVDMQAVGLTRSLPNTAESMLVSIILRAAQTLTETNRLSDLVNRNVTLSYVGQDLIDQGGGNVFLRDTYQVSLYKATTVTPIDPDNY